MLTTTKRFYIVKADDHAVVKSVPVSVCAAPPRVDLARASDAPTSPVETPIDSQDHRAENRGRVADVVRHAVRRPHLSHRPHLPLIGRPGR